MIELLKRIFLRRRQFKTYNLTHLKPGGFTWPQDETTHHRIRWFWQKRERCAGITKKNTRGAR